MVISSLDELDSLLKNGNEATNNLNVALHIQSLF